MAKSTRKRSSRVSDAHIRLHFLGAARAVTGSMHFFEVTIRDRLWRFAVDFGLDQQEPGRDRQNRLPNGVKWTDVDFIVNSHDHLDHNGATPIAVKNGFKGNIYAPEATCELAPISLTDSGYLQEQGTARLSRRILRRCEAANEANGTERDCEDEADVEPLYTQADAIATIGHFVPVKFNKPLKIAEGITLEFFYAAHLLGAAIVKLDLGIGAAKRRVIFSGDLGRPGMPFMQDVAAVTQADYIICEGTYGDREHVKRNRQAILADIIKRASERAKVADPVTGCGAIIIPAFALGRVQSVLFDLREIGVTLPVFVDSPMAIKANVVHRKHPELLHPTAAKMLADGKDPFKTKRYAELTHWEDSVRLDEPACEPFIVVGSSGMAAGGRIVRHLQHRLGGKNNTVIFVGYQSHGTLGRHLTTPGVTEAQIHGETVPVLATIEQMGDYSGHADYKDILRWLGGFTTAPRKIFLVHGDESALLSLKGRIERTLGWNVEVPHLRDYIDLE